MTVDREVMERDLADHLVGREGAGLLPRSPHTQLKTYVVESHSSRSLPLARESLERSSAESQSHLAATDDPSLYLLETPVEDGLDVAGFWVDLANPRFWLLHSKTKAASTQLALRRLVGAANGLDVAWLPRNQLRLLQ